MTTAAGNNTVYEFIEGVQKLREACDNAPEYDGKRGEFYLSYESRGDESVWECELTINDPKRNCCTQGATATDVVQKALAYMSRESS